MSGKSLGEVMSGAPFAMALLKPNGPLLTGLRRGFLYPRDAATLWAVLHHLDHRSGRCWASVEELAAASGCRPQVLELSLSRLQREGLVARGRDVRNRRRQFFCLNPFEVAGCGGSYRRQRQVAQFGRALEEAPSDRKRPPRRPRRGTTANVQAAAALGNLVPSGP